MSKLSISLQAIHLACPGDERAKERSQNRFRHHRRVYKKDRSIARPKGSPGRSGENGYQLKSAMGLADKPEYYNYLTVRLLSL